MILNITAYFIIPVYTFLFAWGTDLFRLNFSVLGSLANRKNAFLLWGIIVFLLCAEKDYPSPPTQPEGDSYKRQRADPAGLRGHHALSSRKQALSGISPRDLRLQRLRAAAGLSLPDRVEALLHEPGSIPSLLHLSEHHHCAVGHALVSGRNRQQRAGNILYRILYSDAHQTVPSCFIVQGRLLQSEAQSLKTLQAACRYAI